MSDFTHLHVHSDGSTPIAHDGLGTVGRLTKAAKEKGFNTLALTDHGNLLNTPSFIAACKLENIKPISGLEAYIEHEGDSFHITLLADGNSGFDTLTNLNNLAQNNWGNKRPRIKLTDFEQHNKDIIVLTGCPTSPLQKLDYRNALDVGRYLKGIFDKRLFAEIMYSGYGEPDTLERSVQLSDKLKIPLITTNDVHFPYPNDAQIHRTLSHMLTDGHMDYDSTLLYLTTQNELEQRIQNLEPKFTQYFKTGMVNAIKLGNKLNPVKLDNTLSLPKIANPDEKLKELISAGLFERMRKNELGDGLPNEVFERLDYEYQIITQMGFSTYFIILNDMVSYAKSINVKIGSGRGSGAGSLILYTLGITDINPLVYGLKFERFINPKRLDFPDVDIDYDSVGRYKVIEYAKQRWNGIPVATYSRYSGDSLFNDLSKYFDIDKFTNTQLKEQGINSQYYKEFIEKEPLYGECYEAICGQIRHSGKHAGGIVITDKNIPMIRISSGEIVASWTEGLHEKELSQFGIVKFDILGISSLDVIAELESKHGKAPKPIDDSEVFKMFRKGDTLGIFQFNSPGITHYMKDVKPRTFMDLAAINALYRPGGLGGSANHYAEYRKNGQRLLHPLIDDILAETYGVIAYQEQFMSIYARVTDKDFGDADTARKTLVKAQGKENNPEWQKKISDLGNEIIQGCLNHGISKETSELIWHEIKAHSGYSFNKAHSVSYAMLAWQLAWYKFYHRADFYAASLNANDGKANEYIFDIVRTGIEVVAPDINKSTDKYVSDGKKIYMPLTSIKGISNAGYDAILTNRPYNSIQDFVDKVPRRKANKNVRQKLYELGCFDNIIDTNESTEVILNSLNVDDYIGNIKTIAEIQKECYGYTIPTKAFFKAVKDAKDKGMIAGIITKIDEKMSKGNKPRAYRRYHLNPYDVIRSYDDFDWQIGDEIQCRYLDNGYGKELIKAYRMDY